MPDVEIRGFKDLDRIFNELGHEVEHRVLDNSVRDAGKIIAKEEQARARVRSGRLKRSIKWLVVKRNPGEIEVDVGPDAKQGFYATFIEFGTRYITAKPFIRPAFRKSIPKVLDAFKGHVDKAVNRVR